MRYDVVALGETLIDFTPAGRSAAGMRLFEQNPGGAPANVLAALAKLGKKTAFIGKVGRDMHGDFLLETLQNAQIDTRGVMQTDEAFTTLAFVSLTESGERDFSFARKPGADTLLCDADLDMELLQNTNIFHVGSLSLTDEPARSATFSAIRAAKAAGGVLSYDPNYRALLWPDVQTAIDHMRSMLPLTDVMKLSDNECELLTGLADPAQAAKHLVAGGIPLVVVTLGAEGALVCTKDGVKTVPGFVCETVADTTGAGDAFWGAFLSMLSECGKYPVEITLDEAADFARFACAAASLCVEKRGAIPAMPTLQAVMERLR